MASSREGDGGSPVFSGWRACDACGMPLDDLERAVLSADSQRIETHRRELREQGQASGGDRDLTQLPDLVPWDWGHVECFPSRDGDYVIPGRSIDTLPKMMAVTVRAMRLDWFAYTVWADVVRRFYELPDVDAQN